MATANQNRPCYALIFKDGAKKEFFADNAAKALEIAKEVLPHGRAAALFEDDSPLAEIGYCASGFWSVSSFRPD